MKPFLAGLLTGASVLTLGFCLGQRSGRRTAYLQGVEAATKYIAG